MKKILILSILILTTALPAKCKTTETSQPDESTISIESGITFDWISKTQLQRDEKINEIKDKLFSEPTAIKYPKQEFKKQYANFLKNPNNINDYVEISKGKTEDAETLYCGFFVGKLLIAYGIQYKNNMKNVYYYDAMGNLRWVDVFSKEYPNYPCIAYQYYIDGRLIAAYYYVSKYDQYVFDANKKFNGRWYYEKLYNRNAKVVMTRTNY